MFGLMKWLERMWCRHSFTYQNFLPAPDGYLLIKVKCENCGIEKVSKPITACGTSEKGVEHYGFSKHADESRRAL